jgi:hypothetical protein
MKRKQPKLPKAPKAPKPPPPTPEQALAAFSSQIIETTRRSLALYRAYPGMAVRYRRMAKPNDSQAMVLTLSPGGTPATRIMLFREIVDLAATVPDAEVYAWLTRNVVAPVDAGEASE